MQRLTLILICLATVSPIFASNSVFQERLQQDWMFQDHGPDVTACFAAQSDVVINNITDDASTGIASGKTYTHLLDFGKAGIAGGATVNGVKFQKVQAAKGVCAINGTKTNYGWDGGLANTWGDIEDDPALAKASGIADLLRDCNYGQKTDMKLTGLTP
ncbi:MAG: hypothetical protein LBU65_02180, partial [Planctomycetaceae bacterium]|nr:hypothetical protein [Planctomycetaceae bacterium]